MKLTLIQLLIFIIACLLTHSTKAQDINIIPKPVKVEKQHGNFLVNENTIIISKNKELAKTCQQIVKKASGYKLNILADFAKKNNSIELLINNELNDLPNEGYNLKIENYKVQITGKSAHGIFNGLQSLQQLFQPTLSTQRSLNPLPCVTITDYPNFKWRGLMLDVSRHFYPTEDIKRFIDYLAFHKMNVFHWHLVDNQGWRLEIKKYPKLTSVGAWRVDREDEHWRTRDWQKESEHATYGGYYSQEEIKEVVQYAKERHIEVVPEIEIPAHVYSALAAYPEYSCFANKTTVPSGANWPNYEIYCAGKESTFRFLEDVLAEVMELFPSEYIHIGGDEADYKHWKECNDCQKRIKKEKLKDEKELQSYFIQRIEKFLNKNNRKLIGWDEILYGGLAKNATMMFWRGWHKDAPKKATSTGNDVIMTTNGFCYFNYYQGDRTMEPLSRKFTIPISKVYNWQVYPDSLTTEEQKHIIGAQANLWGEYIHTPKIAEEMVFPRLAAMSETLWTPAGNKNWDDFCSRIPTLFKWYDAMHMSYSKAIYSVKVKSKTDSTDNNKINIELEKEFSEGEIRYTLDGATPTFTSELYAKAISITENSELRAATFLNGKLLGQITKRSYNFHKAYNAHLMFECPYDKKYNAGGPKGLVDGIHGTKFPKDGKWHGVEEKDFCATIDLGELQSIEKISCAFLQSATYGIYLPLDVTFEKSVDGKDFELIDSVKNTISPKLNADTIETFKLENLQTETKYIRIKATNRKTAPQSALEKVLKAWIFVDEIVVE